MGAVQKDDGFIRLIHDCSVHNGQSVNDIAFKIEKQHFEMMDSAVELLSSNCFTAKVNLKAAYRLVSVTERS